MKKALGFLSFFILGFSASYLFLNEKIVEQKTNFKEEVELLSSNYKAKNLSYIELQKQNEELTGKLFQLLFTYFGIELRDIEFGTINKAKEIVKVETKTVERIVYLPSQSVKDPKEEIQKESKNKLWNYNILGMNLTEFIEKSMPITSKSLEFELLNKRFNSFLATMKNGKHHYLKLDNSLNSNKGPYYGFFNYEYSLLNKDQRKVTIQGYPTNYITNKNYPGIIGVWLSPKRLAIINTAMGSKFRGPRGIVFKRNKFSVFTKETDLKVDKEFYSHL